MLDEAALASEVLQSVSNGEGLAGQIGVLTVLHKHVPDISYRRQLVHLQPRGSGIPVIELQTVQEKQESSV